MNQGLRKIGGLYLLPSEPWLSLLQVRTPLNYVGTKVILWPIKGSTMVPGYCKRKFDSIIESRDEHLEWGRNSWKYGLTTTLRSVQSNNEREIISENCWTMPHENYKPSQGRSVALGITFASCHGDIEGIRHQLRHLWSHLHHCCIISWLQLHKRSNNITTRKRETLREMNESAGNFARCLDQSANNHINKHFVGLFLMQCETNRTIYKYTMQQMVKLCGL